MSVQRSVSLSSSVTWFVQSHDAKVIVVKGSTFVVEAGKCREGDGDVTPKLNVIFGFLMY